MLGVPEHEVISMDHRLTALDFSLNVPASSDNTAEWQDWLVDESESQEDILAESEELNDRKAPLAAALKTLSERECHILTGRWLKERPITLEELSHQHGISRERVRQIEARAFEKVQKVVKAEVDQNKRRRHFPRSTVRRAPTQPAQYQQSALIEFRGQVIPTAQHAA